MKLLGGKWIAAMFGLWLLGLSPPVSAITAPVTLVDGMEPIPLAGHIGFLRDDDGKLTIDDVRSPGVAERFESTRSTSFNFGYTSVPYWYRIRIHNPSGPSDQPSDWVIQAGAPPLDYVDIYIVGASGRVTTALTGDCRPLVPTLLSSRKFAVPLHVAPGQSAEIFVRAVSGAIQVTDFELWHAPAYEKKSAKEHLLYGAYFGVLLVIAIYNFTIYLWIRDRAYLYYILYIFSVIWATAGYTGYARLYGDVFFDSGSILISNSSPQGLLSVNLFVALFVREFMQLRTMAPVASKVFLFFAALAAAGLMLSPVMSYLNSQRLGFLGAALGGSFALAVAVWLSIKGLRAARFFLLAWSVLIATLLAFIVGSFVFNLPFGYTQYAMLFGVCLEAVLLSLALADRITQERKGRFAASESANRLKSYLPQKVADLVSGGDKSLLEPKRRKVTVLVMDLRGFTPFSETSAPEDVMSVLREFYETMGAVVERHGGTVEHFAGDSMLVFFNAPLEIPDPEKQAIETALEMRSAFDSLRSKWAKLGHELGLGIGIADGYATIGAIGFSGRSQYAAIGAVTNLASRLCSQAQHGEILTTSRVLAEIEGLVESESAGEQTIKGFTRPLAVVRVLGPSSRAPV